MLLGQGYVSRMKARRSGGQKPRREMRLENMRLVFGTGSVLTWLLPRVSPPPGALVVSGVPEGWNEAGAYLDDIKTR